MISDLAKSIKDFEKNHSGKDLFFDTGELTDDGWNWLKDAEVNWADDIKWNDYTKFHMRSRIGEFWFGVGEDADVDYWEAWLEIHPEEIMEIS